MRARSSRSTRDLSEQEIAHVVGCAVGTVKSRLRARTAPAVSLDYGTT
jgi:DNA-directed RNA polymerase specialized sigma24 family protein